MIESLSLKLGPAPGEPVISLLNHPAITVFVGPNNSGKSKVLQEIYAACAQGSRNNVILDDIEFDALSPEAAQAALDAILSKPRLGENPASTNVMVQIGPWRAQIHAPYYLQARMTPNAKDHRRSHFSEYFVQHFCVNLNGANRMALVQPQQKGDLKQPSTTFARLLTDDTKRSALREVLHDAVGLYIGIDMSNGSQLELRFGTSPPPPERTVEDETLQWMQTASPAGEVSDGVKAFTGILTELRAGDPRIVVIDEPEAFLHPALASRLGKQLSKIASEGGKHVFAATHSPQFLMGTIQSGVRVDVVRLTYKGGVGTARLLANADVAAMMQDPLLRSANALAGIFYENVVVTEADADRAFYQELNDRMLEVGSAHGIPNSLFVNGNGKDTVHRIVGPLRRLGIPAASILDIDALKIGGTNWLAHLSSCGVPPAQFQQFQNQRATIWQLLERAGADPKRDGGIALLTGQDREAAENFLDDLARYGLFILPCGEVEHWLPNIQVPRNKTWLHNIFAALGSDPTSPTYVRPAADDVWAFVDRVAAWAKNPSRQGIR